MDTMLTLAGVLLLLAGLSHLWMTRDLRRNGRPWRGSAVIATAFLIYGVPLAAGLRPGESMGYSVLVGLAAVWIWGGLWLRLREQR